MRNNRLLLIWTIFVLIHSAVLPAFAANKDENSTISVAILEESDFEIIGSDSANDIKFSCGMIATQNTGYVKTSTIEGSDNGHSLILGIETINDAYVGNIPLAKYGDVAGTSVNYENLQVEFDVYIDTKPMVVNSKYAESYEHRFILFTSGGSTTAISWEQSMEIGSLKVSYEEKTWYRIRVEARQLSNKTFVYDVYRNGELLAENMAAASGLTKLSSVRFYAPRFDSTPTWMAVDNLKITTRKDKPKIKSFGYDDAAEATEIHYDAETLAVNLTDTIADIHAGEICLYCNGRSVDIKDVAYDGAAQRILIRTNERFKPNTTYEVVLDPEIMIMEGIKLGIERRGTFRTTSDSIKIGQALFTPTENGVTFSAMAANVTDEPQIVYLVASVWSGERFEFSRMAKCTIDVGESKPIKLELSEISENCKAEVCGWNNPQEMCPLTDVFEKFK